MTDVDPFVHQKLDLERERIKLERQRLAADLTLPKKDASKTLWANPVALAVVGGFITLMTSVFTAAYTASENREAEALRAEYARQSARDTFQADLIKKFVEGPSPGVVRGNLKFLVDVGLLPTYAKDITAYLKANPDAAPQINVAPVSGVVGIDDAVAFDSLPRSDPLIGLGQSVGRLIRHDGTTACTAFLVGADTIVTAGHCVDDRASLLFSIGTEKIAARIIEHKFIDMDNADYSLLRLAQPPSSAPPVLKLAAKAPAVGDRLSIVMFRASSTKLAVKAPDCVVVISNEQQFEHGCDTGKGSGGAPIFAENGQVVGIHGGRSSADGHSRGWATRADIVASALGKLK